MSVCPTAKGIYYLKNDIILLIFVEPSVFRVARAKKPIGWSLRQAFRSSRNLPAAIPDDILNKAKEKET